MTAISAYGIWRRHAANVGAPLVSKALTLVAFMVAVSAFINRRGEADYAPVGLLITCLTFAPALDFGIGYALTLRMVRTLSRKRADAWRVVVDAMPVFAFSALALAAIGFLAADPASSLLFGTEEYGLAIAITAAAAALLVLDAMPSAVLQAFNRVDILAWTRLLADLGRSTVVLLAAYSGMSLSHILVGFLALAAIKLVVTSSIAGGLLGKRPGTISFRGTRLTVALGAPLGLCMLLSTLFNLSDKFISARLLGDVATARYLIAVDVNVRAYFLIWAVHGALYTLFMQAAVARESPQRLIKVALAAASVVGLVYYIPLFLFADQVMALWINAAFAEHTSILVRVLVVASLAYMLIDLHTLLLRAYRKTKAQLVGLIAGLLVMVAGAFLWAPAHGPLGIAYAVTLGHTAMLLVYIAYARQYGLYR